MSSEVKLYKVNWKAIHDLLCMCFIQTLILRCTVSEIFAKIDHKGPNWTFLTLHMTFKVIPHLSYFRTVLVSQQRGYLMQYIWAALCYLGIKSLIMGNGTNLTFLTLKVTFWIIQSNSSLDSWSISSPRSCIPKIKNKFSDQFWENCQKVTKYPIWPFLTIWTLNNDLYCDSIKSIFWQSIITILGTLLDKTEKMLPNNFWENCLQVENGPNLTFPTFKLDL